MSSGIATSAGKATDQTVSPRPNGHLFHSVMRAARGWWGSKVPAQLAAIIGCDPRSASRYLAGDRTADAEAVLKIIRSDWGVRLVEAATDDLPSKQYEAFWQEMERAARRASLRARREALDHEELELMRRA